MIPNLLELSRVVTRSLDLQEVLDQSFAALRTMVDFDGGAIQLVEEGFLRAAATDPPATPEALAVRIPVGQGVSGTIAANGEPIYIPDITVDERVHPEGRKRGLSGGVRSYFGAPLIEGGSPVGVVQIDSTTIDAFDTVDRELVLSFLPTITAAVQNARLFAREQLALERLQELDRLQQDFLSVISHELRTPVVSIIGYADLMASGTYSTEQMRSFASTIKSQGGHLARLIEDVLEVSGLNTTGIPLAGEPAAAELVVHEVLSTFEDRASRVRVTVEAPLPAVLVDPGRLERVVGSLVENALKFSDDLVEVSLQAAGGRVELSVTDHGPGIAPEFQERVFERFFQVDQTATRRYGGMGLGLFLAHNFCQRMNIDLRLDSNPDEGSTFTLSIPLAT